MATLSSVSIKLADQQSDSPEVAALEAKYGSRLDSLDADGDGKIDRTELLMFIRDVTDRERKLKYLKAAAIGLIVVLVLFALTTFGTVWAVVVLSQKVETGGNGGSGLGAALVSSESGETLRTALGMVVVTPMAPNASGAMGVLENADEQTRRRLLVDGDQSYLGELAPQDVISGCELLLEGNSKFTTTIPSSDGTDEEVGTVDVQTASLSACRKAVKNGIIEGLEAVLFVSLYDSDVRVRCGSSSSCGAYLLESNFSDSEGGTPSPSRRRRLLGDFKRGAVSVSFGSYVLDCTEDQCSSSPRIVQEVRVGRELLGGPGCASICDACGDDPCSDACTSYCSADYCMCCGRSGTCTRADYPSCFPGSSVVYLEDGKRQTMRDLSIGDRVLTIGASGALEASDVYVMPHAVSSGTFQFKRFTMATNHSVTMTPDHYMLVGGFPGGSWEHRRAVPARYVKVGDRVWVMDGVSSQLIETSIREVSDVFEEGIFAPLTLTGTILADGVVASVYSDMLGSESAMHTFCAWGRWLWGVVPKLFLCLHSLGWASPISMGIGHLARAGLRLSTTLL